MSFVRRHPVSAFLGLTYVLAIVILGLPVLSNLGLGIVPIDLPGKEPFLLLLTFALVGAAFAVTAVADGREGVRDYRRRVLRFRTSPVWYGAALLVLPAAALAIAVAVGGAAPLSMIASDPAIAVGWVVELAVALVLINFWEEAVWTGFVLHRLQPRFGPVRTTALTTWGQAAIHLPLLFVVGGLSDSPITPDLYPFYLAALFILPLGNRTVLTWLYNRSGHSVPVAGLTHSSWNLATGSAFLPVLLPGFNSVWAYAGFAIVAVALIVATRGRLGYHRSGRGERRASRAPFDPAEAAAR
jgi:membrane protease YdiL (CAAX protease family)